MNISVHIKTTIINIILFSIIIKITISSYCKKKKRKEEGFRRNYYFVSTEVFSSKPGSKTPDADIIDLM